MKYFAHYCSAQDDPKIASLLELHGFMGTGIFWHLCEVVAGMKKGSQDIPEYRVNVKILAKLGANHTQTVTKVILNLAKLGLIECREDAGAFIIKIPKLNNYMDENAKRRDREKRNPRRRGAGHTIVDHKGLTTSIGTNAPPSSGGGVVPPSDQTPDQEPGVEDPQARAEALKVIKAMTDKLNPKAEPKAVEIPKASRSEELDKPGQPKTVDPALEAELVDTRADIISKGFDPARANQIITQLAEYHSGRIDGVELSVRLDGIVTSFEKMSLFEVDGVIERRGA